MEKENEMLSLINRFGGLSVQDASVSRRRIFLEATPELCPDLIRFAKDELGFGHLITITGFDDGARFVLIYHLSRDDGIVLNIKRPVDKENPSVPSVLPLFEGAQYYEREVEGLLGIRIEGLSEGRQYPLPDNWKNGYPLRKDWKPKPQDSKG